MKKTFSIAVAAVAVVASTAGFAAELPSYEANGIPASPVQVRLLGAAHVEQQQAAPASSVTPLQASVLVPRTVKTAITTAGSAR